jgi:3-deoxy-D-arabino-heptulosonate 7-phosphate (DAHP) synthase class II
MRTPNECWMDLHRLAGSLEAEGLTKQERLDNLTKEFLALPPLVRQELLTELRFLLAELADLEPLVINATDTAEEKKVRSRAAG